MNRRELFRWLTTSAASLVGLSVVASARRGDRATPLKPDTAIATSGYCEGWPSQFDKTWSTGNNHQVYLFNFDASSSWKLLESA